MPKDYYPLKSPAEMRRMFRKEKRELAASQKRRIKQWRKMAKENVKRKRKR